jgi:transposase
MGPERIELSARERERLKVLQQVEDGHLKQSEAARRLRLTDRHIRRLQKRLRAEGDAGIVHRLRGRRSNRKIPESVEQRAMRQLRQTRYAGFGPTLAAEHLARRGIPVSRETLRQWMSTAGLWRPRNRRRKAVHQSLAALPRPLSAAAPLPGSAALGNSFRPTAYRSRRSKTKNSHEDQNQKHSASRSSLEEALEADISIWQRTGHRARCRQQAQGKEAIRALGITRLSETGIGEKASCRVQRSPACVSPELAAGIQRVLSCPTIRSGKAVNSQASWTYTLKPNSELRLERKIEEVGRFSRWSP